MSKVQVIDLQYRSVLGSHNSGLDISGAVTLSPSSTYNPSGAGSVVIQAVTQNVRFTLDGTTPTSSVGFQIVAGDPPVLIPVSGNVLKVIEETATASLQFEFGG